jgi:hypothetical protein
MANAAAAVTAAMADDGGLMALDGIILRTICLALKLYFVNKNRYHK